MQKAHGATKVTAGEFEIAVNVGCARHPGSTYGCKACDATPAGRETRRGYVAHGAAGGFGARKGQYFWEFTHLATGMRLVMPREGNRHCIESLAAAKSTLGMLANGEIPSVLAQVEGLGWGGASSPCA